MIKSRLHHPIVQALTKHYPTASWRFIGDDFSYEALLWNSEDIEKPSKEDLESKAAVIQAELDATEYQAQRVEEYPPLADFVDAYYWAQKGDNTKMDEYVVKCDTVKAKYPKP